MLTDADNTRAWSFTNRFIACLRPGSLLAGWCAWIFLSASRTFLSAFTFSLR